MRRAPQGNQAAQRWRRARRAPESRAEEPSAAQQACRTRSRPARARGHAPKTKPIAPPTSASINCSARKMPPTSAFVAPIAFMMPISARRSSTVAAEVAATASAAAISAASVTIQSSVLTCERILPSVSATRRIARTSVPGSTCLDLVADRRNVGRAEPAVVFGGRHATGIRARRAHRRAWSARSRKAAGIGRDGRKALRDRKRHEHGIVFRAAGGDDARHHQRKAPRLRCCSWHRTVLPTANIPGSFAARFAPTTHSSAPSPNHRPSNLPPGMRDAEPVVNFVPSGDGTRARTMCRSV